MFPHNSKKLPIQLLIAVVCTKVAQADSMSFLSSDSLPLNLTQVALPAKTQATPPSGEGRTSISHDLYLMGDVGVEMTQDVKFKNSTNFSEKKFGLDTGMRFDLGVGCDITNFFAIEATAGLIWNSISTISATLTSSNTPLNFNIDGNLYNVPIMFNGKFRIPITKELNSPEIVVGAGIGTLWSQVDIDSIAGISNSSSGSAWAFAYQATVGVDWKIGSRLHLGVAYAFLGTTQLNFGADSTANALYTNSILATLRYEF